MMAARVEEDLGVAVPLRPFFERPTVRALARSIAAHGGGAAAEACAGQPPPRPAASAGRPPTSRSGCG